MSGAVLNPTLPAEPGLVSVAPQAGQLLASQVIRRSFRMAIFFLAARMLGVESFGAYALLLAMVEMIALISGTSYVDFLTREVAQCPDSAWPLAKKVTLLRLAYVAPALGLALLGLTALRFPWPVLLNVALLALTLLPRAVGESAQGLMKGMRHFAHLPWIEFAQGAIVLGCAALFILTGMGIRGVIAAEILGAGGGAALAVKSVVGRLHFPGADTRILRALARSTIPFNLYPLIANIYDRVDVLLLAKLAGNFAVGIYSLPYRFFAMLLIVPYGAMGALLPVFSSVSTKHTAQELCSSAMKFLFLMSLLVVLVTLTFARPVVLFFLGPGYAGSVLTVKILVWAGVPAFLNFALNVFLLAAHKEKAFLWTATACTVFNIAANLLLIPRFSFIAAAGVTVATECLLLAQNLYLVRKFIGRVVLPKDGLKIAAVFAVALAGFALAQRAAPQLWAGSVACAAFAVFAIATMPGLLHLRMAAVRKGIE